MTKVKYQHERKSIKPKDRTMMRVCLLDDISTRFPKTAEYYFQLLFSANLNANKRVCEY